MQATSVFSMPVSINGMEVSAETAASGRGMHISSAQSSKENRTLFTRILDQGMVPEDLTGQKPAVTAEPAAAGEQGDGVSAEDAAVESVSMDVCALLVQLNVLGTAAVLAAGSVDQAAPAAAASAIVAVNPELTAALPGTVDLKLANTGYGMPAEGSEAVTADAGQDNASAVVNGINNAINNAINLTERTATANVAPSLQTAVTAPVAAGLKDSAAAGAQNTAAVTRAAAIQPDGSTLQAADSVRARRSETVSEGDRALSGRADGVSSLPAAASDKAAAAIKAVGAAGSGEQTGEGVTAGHSRLAEDNPPETPGILRAETVGAFQNAPPAEDIPAADKSAAIDKAFLRIANWTDDVLGLRADSREINIVLEPEELGVLTISVIHSENGISAQIKSESKELCSIMSDRLQHLISAMETKGIAVRDVDVVYSQDRQGAGFSQQAFSQQRDHTPGGNGAPREHKQERTPESSFREGIRDSEIRSSYDSEETTVEYRI